MGSSTNRGSMDDLDHVQSTGAMSLPHDTIINIMSRVPAEPLLRFRCVCKLWCGMVRDPDFIDLHLSRAIKEPGLIIQPSLNKAYRPGDIYLVKEGTKKCKVNDNDEQEIKVYQPLIGISVHHIAKRIALKSSCNGLILFAEPEEKNPTCICNPLTGEYIVLPKFCRQHRIEVNPIFGFGFSCKTKEYKVVRLFYPPFDFGCMDLDTLEGAICTVGTKSWRQIGEIPYPLFVRRNMTSLFVNGALHWIIDTYNHDGPELILSFNISDEKFQTILSPYPGLEAYYVSLTNLGGCLSVVDCSSASHVDIWILKDQATNIWTKEHTIIAEFLSIEGFLNVIQVGKKDEIFIEGVDRDSMAKKGHTFIEPADFRMFYYCLYGKRFWDVEIPGVTPYINIIGHVGSLVSLKSVGGKKMQDRSIYRINVAQGKDDN